MFLLLTLPAAYKRTAKTVHFGAVYLHIYN